jgi:hypothetical protein
MHTGIRSLIAAAFGVALTGSLAHAQLSLSGHTTGWFDDPGLPNTFVVNGAGGSSASFTTGIPYAPNTIPTSLKFTNSVFANVHSGDTIQLGIFTIHNGSDLLGSDASNANFHFGLQLTAPTMQTINLGPINFTIDNTPNGPGGVPDTFLASFVQPPMQLIDNHKVWFHINFSPVALIIPENTTLVKGDVTVTFQPVPEPSTYALWGAGLLVGFVAFRRFRSARTLPSLSAAA